MWRKGSQNLKLRKNGNAKNKIIRIVFATKRQERNKKVFTKLNATGVILYFMKYKYINEIENINNEINKIDKNINIMFPK